MNNYSSEKFEPTNKEDKKPLWHDIRKFSKNKYFFAIFLLLLALLGILVPIIPGIIFFILAIALLRKGWMSKIRTRFRLWRINK